GWPSTSTVQAPHCAMPQPNLVPVRPRTSRSTQSRGMSSLTATSCSFPFTFSFMVLTSPDRQKRSPGEIRWHRGKSTASGGGRSPSAPRGTARNAEGLRGGLVDLQDDVAPEIVDAHGNLVRHRGHAVHLEEIAGQAA